MRAVLFNTEAEAKQFSANEATSRGCSGVTTEWYPIIAHEQSWAVLVGEDEINGVVEILKEGSQGY